MGRKSPLGRVRPMCSTALRGVTHPEVERRALGAEARIKVVKRDEACLAGVALTRPVQRRASGGVVGGGNGASSRPGDGKARAVGCVARRRAVAERLRQPRRAALAPRLLLLDCAVGHLAQVAHATGRPALATLGAVVAVAAIAAIAPAVHREYQVAAAASTLLTEVPQPADAAAAQLGGVQVPSVELDLLRLPRLHRTHTHRAPRRGSDRASHQHCTVHNTVHHTAHCTH